MCRVKAVPPNYVQMCQAVSFHSGELSKIFHLFFSYLDNRDNRIRILLFTRRTPCIFARTVNAFRKLLLIKKKKEGRESRLSFRRSNMHPRRICIVRAAAAAKRDSASHGTTEESARAKVPSPK